MAQLTPMMQIYMKTKEQYKDCILFYRLGDFYEMFFEDAEIASKELGITLTGKDCGLEKRAPMCGVPYHAVDTYLNKLVSKGYKVAICEQLEDPKYAKGIVKRGVVRVVTPGTNLSMQSLDAARNNYLMCIIYIEDRFGISTADISTGDYYVTEVDADKKLMDEIVKFAPAEIIYNDAFCMSGVNLDDLKERMHISLFALDSWYIDEEVCEQTLKKHFQVQNLSGLGLQDYPTGMIAAGALLQYLYETQKNSLSQMTHIVPYSAEKYMIIDSYTRRNLELFETLREKEKRGSLLWVLDKTKTAMGARLLRTWMEQPFIEKDPIEKRLDAIEELNTDLIKRDEIRENLKPIYDLERLISRISSKTANPRDLIAFKTSLAMIVPVKNLMKEYTSSELSGIYAQMDELNDIWQLIEDSIVEDPPVILKDGGIIKEGFNEDVDQYRKAKTEGRQWVAQLEAREREKTGIKNLKVKYNKVFGYYLEVTNSYKSMVPNDWMRKQTLTNAERYITPELKELEDKIMGAEEKLISLEAELFTQVRDQIADEVRRIQKTAKALAHIDVLTNLAYVAQENQYVRPRLNTEGVIDIKGGRHPVVERMSGGHLFVENDTYLDNEDHRISIITGPNMAGKSTYMRQSALIVLMAQMGSFVPADSANIGIVDRIFTRVGASDDLASGQSTFMVEMTEVANILRNATRDSLLILDEIGRGTSTLDGLSIAWAVVEYISNPRLLGAKTLFATHFHELTELEGKLSGVENFRIAVKEQGEDIIFLRKIVKGGADKSYGIQVAKLAGIPDKVVERAKELEQELSKDSLTDYSRRAATISEQRKENLENLAQERDYPDSFSQKAEISSQKGETSLLKDEVENFAGKEKELPAQSKKEKDYGENSVRGKKKQENRGGNQQNDHSEILERIRKADLARMRPLDALIFLDELQQNLTKEE